MQLEWSFFFSIHCHCPNKLNSLEYKQNYFYSNITSIQVRLVSVVTASIKKETPLKLHSAWVTSVNAAVSFVGFLWKIGSDSSCAVLFTKLFMIPSRTICSPCLHQTLSVVPSLTWSAVLSPEMGERSKNWWPAIKNLIFRVRIKKYAISNRQRKLKKWRNETSTCWAMRTLMIEALIINTSH